MNVKLWILLVSVGVALVVGLIVGGASGYLFEKRKVDACHRMIDLQSKGLAGIEDYDSVDAAKKDFDLCGVSLES